MGLTLATGITGICYILAKYFKRKQARITTWAHAVNEYCASFFPAFLIILGMRSFVIENYRIPTSSLKPTLLVGDFLIANKFAYGVRLPVISTLITSFKSPARGDIVAFRSPLNPAVYFIKRVIGLPGDRIEYRQKILTINGQLAKQHVIKLERDEESNGHYWPVLLSEEDLAGYKHVIYTRLDPQTSTELVGEKLLQQNFENITVTVPEGQYFVMGDNRDNSFDSRHWGFVPADHLLGKAKWIFFSWNSQAAWHKPMTWIRWERIGMKIV
jgi:signal peptidase I